MHITIYDIINLIDCFVFAILRLIVDHVIKMRYPERDDLEIVTVALRSYISMINN